MNNNYVKIIKLSKLKKSYSNRKPRCE